MQSSKMLAKRWAQGQRRASLEVARDARRAEPDLSAALRSVDELRRFADQRGARGGRRRAERENLAFHLAWRRVRRAFGFGE
jgi:hypothetical protein